VDFWHRAAGSYSLLRVERGSRSRESILIAAYVSGHGFGHATRSGEVLRELLAMRDVALTVVSSAPEGLFRTALGTGFEYRRVECDVGLAQHDALRIDEPGTLDRWRAFAQGESALVQREAAWLKRRGARLVVGDIPPLAFAAAARAGVASVGLANFSWDWIYRHLARRVPGLEQAAAAAATAYASASLLLRLPFAGDLTAFPRIEDVPLVARRPQVSGAEVRRRLGLDRRPLVLLSLGGVAGPAIDSRGLAALDRFQFVVPKGAASGGGANLLEIAADHLAGARLGFVDLVGAADAVVSKPGYGIVSDCIGAGARLVYTDRGDFPEYPILVGEMTRHLRALHVDQRVLLSGALGPALDQVLSGANPPAPDLGGARRAAERLLERAG
jgi:L-arabinokinase